MVNPPLSFKNRWQVAASAILIQLALGIIYAWSVFTPTLLNNGWKMTQTQYVFAAQLASFAIAMVIAGKKMNKNNASLMAKIGGIILGCGYILAGLFAGFNPWLITLFIGLIGGIGIGIAYVVPIAVSISWFPDKKGLITGLAVAGFGFGATLWVKLADSWLKLLNNIGLEKTLITYGLLFISMTTFGAIRMKYPKTPIALPEKKNKAVKKSAASLTQDVLTAQMLKKISFYQIFTTFMFSAGAGLMTIGLMKILPKQALVANNSNLSAEQAGVIAGTAMAVFFSLANGFGRILWGIFSDKIGRKLSLILMTASQGILIIFFPLMAKKVLSLYLAATLIGFNFGGNFSLFPTITADTFGTKYLAQNYGWVFLAYGLGGILGPILGGKLGDLGNFSLAFTICGGLCLLAAAIISQIKKAQA